MCCNNHTSCTTQHWVPWQTLLPWLSGNFEKMMIVVPLKEWRKMEGKVIWGQTLSNARRQCDCVFMSVSFQCVILANVSRESSFSWDKGLFPFAVWQENAMRTHFELEQWEKRLHQVDKVASDSGQQTAINERNNSHGSHCLSLSHTVLNLQRDCI